LNYELAKNFHTWVQIFTPGFNISYSAAKLFGNQLLVMSNFHTWVQNFKPGFNISCSAAKLSGNQLPLLSKFRPFYSLQHIS
jgi:hypothetical protein